MATSPIIPQQRYVVWNFWQKELTSNLVDCIPDFFGTEAIVDVLIAFSLSALLWKRRTGFQK